MSKFADELEATILSMASSPWARKEAIDKLQATHERDLVEARKEELSKLLAHADVGGNLYDIEEGKVRAIYAWEIEERLAQLSADNGETTK